MRELSDADVLYEVLVTPRDAFTRTPDMRVIDEPGWRRIVTPSFTQGGLNEVSYCALDEAEVDAALDEAVADYARLGVRFRFTVGPDARPRDLGERLRARGFVGHASRGMARDVSPLPPKAAVSERREDARGVEVTCVGPGLIGTYTRVMAEGWGVDVEPLERYHDALAREPSRNRLFLATVDGEPAAAASYVAFERSAYLVGGLVLPRFRGCGLYRRLVSARIDDARASGIPLVTTHAMAATSAPILEALGFRDVCALEMFLK